MTQIADLREPVGLRLIDVGMNGQDWLYVSFEAERWYLRVNLPRAQAKELASALRTKSWASRVRESGASELSRPQGIGQLKLSIGVFSLPEKFARVAQSDPRVTKFRTSTLQTALSVRAHVAESGGAVVALDLAGEPLATILDWRKAVEIAQSLELLEERFDACVKAGSVISVQIDAYGLPWAKEYESSGLTKTLKLEGFGDATPDAYAN